MNYDEKAAELWLDASPGREHGCHNPIAVRRIAVALRECAAQAYEEAAILDRKDGLFGSKERVEILQSKAAALREAVEARK